MKPIAIFLILITLSTTLSTAQQVNIPDASFLQFLVNSGCDTSGDGKIQSSEAALVTNMDLANLNIEDLTGIEAFVNLDTLNCSSNKLSTLDLSYNLKLSLLICSINKLTSLNVSKNSLLAYLYCSNSKLTSLDVSNNPGLIHLDCSFNKLTAIDVSHNTELTLFECYSNKLTTLNLFNNSNLTSLYCDNNQLTSLDLSHNTSLITLNCGYNQIADIDLSKSTELTVLSCFSNQFVNLDLSNNTKLVHLDCGFNPFVHLDLSKNTNLNSVDCALSPNLKYVCVADTALVNSNFNFFKDPTAQWTEDCSLTPVDESQTINTFRLNPNPSKGAFNLSLQQPAYIQIVNVTGTEIQKFDNILYLTFGQNYSEGLYFMNIVFANNSRKTIKLVKD